MLGADSGARGSPLRVTDQAPSPAPTRTSAAPPSARIVRGVRILIVAMYFPPAGGGGVQRPLRFAQHLVDLGFDVHALAPDDPKWVHRDPTLGFPAGVTVHRARNLGPASRRRGEREFRPRLLLRRALGSLDDLVRLLAADRDVGICGVRDAQEGLVELGLDRP